MLLHNWHAKGKLLLDIKTCDNVYYVSTILHPKNSRQKLTEVNSWQVWRGPRHIHVIYLLFTYGVGRKRPTQENKPFKEINIILGDLGDYPSVE